MKNEKPDQEAVKNSIVKKSIHKFTITRRYLPHWQSPNSVYFITTRCIKGATLTSIQRDIIVDAIKYFNKIKYLLYALVVMPDHFHLIIQPVQKNQGEYYSLSEIMHGVKSFTAHKIGNRIWQHENFDRIIRDDDELSEKMNYIINNPLKTGLVEDADEYKWLLYLGKHL